MCVVEKSGAKIGAAPHLVGLWARPLGVAAFRQGGAETAASAHPPDELRMTHSCIYEVAGGASTDSRGDWLVGAPAFFNAIWPGAERPLCADRRRMLPSMDSCGNPALEQQVLDSPQRERKPHVHYHCQTDDLGRGVEIAKGTGGSGSRRAAHQPPPSADRAGSEFSLTVPDGDLEASPEGTVPKAISGDRLALGN